MVTSGKYFIAVVLRGRALDEAGRIKGVLLTEFNLKGALRSPAHITLHRPFEWKTEKEQELISRLRAFSFHPGFRLTVSGFGSFGERVIFLALAPDPTLDKLHKSLTDHCKKKLKLLNEYEDKRGFHPHVTVAFRDLKRRQFNQVWQFLQPFRPEESHLVDGFSLLRLGEKWEEIFFFPFHPEPGTL